MILALDIGTSSVRASLFDHEAYFVPGTSVKVEQVFTHETSGAAEIDADEAFANVVFALDQLHTKADAIGADIELAASCAYWHSLVGVDAEGNPTTKVLGWADTRAGKYSTLLKIEYDEAKTHNRTGARFHSSYWPAKLLWMREQRPDVWATTAKWLSFSDYVVSRLFGERQTSVSMASGTGLLDLRSCAWDEELLEYLRVEPSRLPAIADDDAELILTDEYRRRWSRFAGTRWRLPIGDGAADNIGSGCVDPSRAALMIGTSGAMRVAYKGPPPLQLPPGLWCYRIDRKTVTVGGAISDGGGLYEWLRQNLRLPNDLETEIARRGPGAKGLAFMPFLFGERGTGYHENATGAILGLTSGHDAIDIMQAAMESIAYRFAEIFDQLKTLFEITEIVASGGALRESRLWPQIIADVLGRDLVIKDAEESSLRGSLLHLLKTQGTIVDEVLESDRKVQVVSFDTMRHAAYSETRDRHRSVYESTIRSQ